MTSSPLHNPFIVCEHLGKEFPGGGTIGLEYKCVGRRDASPVVLEGLREHIGYGSTLSKFDNKSSKFDWWHGV
jgi:hypothetical protein